MEMEMRMEGNNAEQGLAATGVEWRCGLCRQRQRELALGQCAISNNGNVGTGWPSEWRWKRNTGLLSPL